MGVWNEQNYLTQADMDLLKEQQANCNKEYQWVCGRIAEIKAKGVIFSDERTRLLARQIELQTQIKELKKKFQDNYLEFKHEKIFEAGIDPTDPRELLSLANGLIKKLKLQVKTLGGQYDPSDFPAMEAIELYLRYQSRAPKGKLKFVPAQVEH
jgi:chromosome segregation ATPase